MRDNHKNTSWRRLKSVGKSKLVIMAAILFVLSMLSSCKKLIEINQSGSTLLTNTVFTDSATVQSTLAGLYNINGVLRLSTSTFPGFSADELQYVGTIYDPFINNSLLSSEGNVNSIWGDLYKQIYNANSIIEGIAGSKNLSIRFQNQALGEARFMRAYAYFYLVNFFGDVPLILTTNVSQSSTMARTPVAEVYGQIIADLKFAQNVLPSDYSISGSARTRANKWAATAMLAKADLYTENWDDAETQATLVISNTALFNLPADLTKVFASTSTEAILQFYNDPTGYTLYAATVLPNAATRIPTYVLTPSLSNAFEPGDARKTNWTSSLNYNGATYLYPTKYKSVTMGANAEYYTPLRLAELYLIRAEARVQQNNFAGAQGDVSVIRNRAGLGNTTAGDRSSLLLAIEQERRIELNSEGGNRWFDLKRTGRVNEVIGTLKPAFWQPTAQLYPVPQLQISANANLKQNPGYN